MRDPNKNVTFVFKCYEKESADLKIRLRYDGLKQSEFFRTLLKMYVSQEPLMIRLVEEIKERQRIMGKKRRSKATREICKGKETLEELGITKTEKQNLFDIIEEGSNYYE